MYSNAILLKGSNENPKKHKSLINDEKTDGAADALDSSLPSEVVASEAMAGDSTNVGDIEVTVELES